MKLYDFGVTAVIVIALLASTAGYFATPMLNSMTGTTKEERCEMRINRLNTYAAIPVDQLDEADRTILQADSVFVASVCAEFM